MLGQQCPHVLVQFSGLQVPPQLITRIWAFLKGTFRVTQVQETQGVGHD